MHRVRCCDIGSGELGQRQAEPVIDRLGCAGARRIRSLRLRCRYGQPVRDIALVRQPRQIGRPKPPWRNRPRRSATLRQCASPAVIVVGQDHHSRGRRNARLSSGCQFPAPPALHVATKAKAVQGIRALLTFDHIDRGVSDVSAYGTN